MRVNLRLPETMVEELHKLCSRYEITRNRLMVEAIRKEMEVVRDQYAV